MEFHFFPLGCTHIFIIYVITSTMDEINTDNRVEGFQVWENHTWRAMILCQGHSWNYMILAMKGNKGLNRLRSSNLVQNRMVTRFVLSMWTWPMDASNGPGNIAKVCILCNSASWCSMNGKQFQKNDIRRAGMERQGRQFRFATESFE